MSETVQKIRDVILAFDVPFRPIDAVIRLGKQGITNIELICKTLDELKDCDLVRYGQIEKDVWGFWSTFKTKS